MAFPLVPRVLLCSVALCLSGPLFAQSRGGAPSKTVLCCEDENNRPICGDVLPAACYGRAYREMSSSGTILRQVAAPLSPEEIAQRRVEAQRQKEENERAIVQRKLDRALLEMYTDAEEIDLSEKRALADLEKDIGDLRAHELELHKKEATLQHETQLYGDGELPSKLAKELAAITKERVSYRELIATKEGERKAIRERYAQERKRFAELTN